MPAKSIFKISIVCVSCFFLIGCGSTKQATDNRRSSVLSYIEGRDPDPAISPGVANPDITQENIKDTICNPSWHTSSIRPPTSYTKKIKTQQIEQYGFTDKVLGHYEEDHVIPLEVGGHPTDPKNLFPESYEPKPGAIEKDRVENYLHKQVCNGSLTLKEAQQEIVTSWYEVYRSLPNR